MRWLPSISTLLAGAVVGCAAAAPLHTDGTDSAGGPALDDKAQAKDEDAERDQKICHYERTLGSNLPRKVCYTKRDREEQRARALRRLERQRLQSPVGP